MSKQLKNIIIAGTAVILLTGVFLLLKFLPNGKGGTTSSSVSSTTQIKLVDKKSEDVKSIFVKNATDTYTVTANGNTQTIDKLTGYPLNSSSITYLISNAASISADKKIDDNPSDIKQYGLDKPSASVTVTFADNSTYKFEIGSKAPGDTGYYFREQGKNTVYLISAYSLSGFTDPITSFVNTTLTETLDNQKLSEIDNIVLGGSSRTEFLIKKYTDEELKKVTGGDPYKLIKPVEIGANSTTISTILQSFNGINAVSVESLDTGKANLKKYGLDIPKYSVSYDYNKKTTKILFGNKDKDGNYYAMIPGGKVIYTVSSASFNYLDYKLSDIASTLPFMVNIDKVKTITVSWNEKQYKFDLTGEGDNLKVKSGDKDIDTDIFRTLYQVFIGGSIKGEENKPKSKAALTIKFDYKDAAMKSDTLSYLPITSQKYFIDINGKGYFYLLRNFIDKVMTSCEKVYNGEKITADY